jgi:hypothetical protein
MMGNKAYYANRQLFNSSLISRSSKLQIYHTLVHPVFTNVVTRVQLFPVLLVCSGNTFCSDSWP